MNELIILKKLEESGQIGKPTPYLIGQLEDALRKPATQADGVAQAERFFTINGLSDEIARGENISLNCLEPNTEFYKEKLPSLNKYAYEQALRVIYLIQKKSPITSAQLHSHEPDSRFDKMPKPSRFCVRVNVKEAAALKKLIDDCKQELATTNKTQSTPVFT